MGRRRNREPAVQLSWRAQKLILNISERIDRPFYKTVDMLLAHSYHCILRGIPLRTDAKYWDRRASNDR